MSRNRIRTLYINPAFNVNSYQSTNRVAKDIENAETPKSKIELAIQAHIDNNF